MSALAFPLFRPRLGRCLCLKGHGPVPGPETCPFATALGWRDGAELGGVAGPAGCGFRAGGRERWTTLLAAARLALQVAPRAHRRARRGYILRSRRRHRLGAARGGAH